MLRGTPGRMQAKGVEAAELLCDAGFLSIREPDDLFEPHVRLSILGEEALESLEKAEQASQPATTI
jgi:hypothetical protein